MIHQISAIFGRPLCRVVCQQYLSFLLYYAIRCESSCGYTVGLHATAVLTNRLGSSVPLGSEYVSLETWDDGARRLLTLKTLMAQTWWSTMTTSHSSFIEVPSTVYTVGVLFVIHNININSLLNCHSDVDMFRVHLQLHIWSP